MMKFLRSLVLAAAVAFAPVAADAQVIGAPLAPTATGRAATGQIPGTATNDSAAAGKVGEFVTASLASGSAVSLTTSVVSNVTSISLTAGDWDVTAILNYTGGATTTFTRQISSISTSSGSAGSVGTMNRSDTGYPSGNAPFNSGDVSVPVGPTRLSLSGTTTVYLTAFATFGTSTASAYGTIRARRVR